MMSRFTERAKGALQKAQQIMFAKQHTQLDIEHVFLALLQQPESLTSEIITHLGGDPRTMLRPLEEALGSAQTFSGSRGVSTGYITLRCSRVLQGAADEADRLNDHFISTEHIFLSIVNEGGGAAGQLLNDAGIKYERAVGALEELRPNGPSEPEAPGEPEAPTAHRYYGEMRRIIRPSSLARPVGFSHGIVTLGGRMLFLAGQTSIDSQGQLVAPGDIMGQYRQVLSNLEAVVEEAGGDITEIVKMTIFVADRDNYIANLKPLGLVHKEFFGDYYPATALLEVSRFFQDGVMIEIEGIAVLARG
ncbi:MAG TPA: Clp protease N-terminal domain-containing protein [Chloroflexia bacterium]|nr:Clp protease N-terminal domain-containing protein [Chloroflexia bacterium]